MKKLIGCLFLMFSASISAQSDDFGPSQQWLLAKYDTNGDAQISQKEVLYKRRSLFARLDYDSNGEVSFDEYEVMDKAKRKYLLESRFAKLDNDADGKVSRQEYGSYLGLFESIDSNRDGTVTQSEMVERIPEIKQTTRCLLWFCLKTPSTLSLSSLFD